MTKDRKTANVPHLSLKLELELMQSNVLCLCTSLRHNNNNSSNPSPCCVLCVLCLCTLCVALCVCVAVSVRCVCGALTLRQFGARMPASPRATAGFSATISASGMISRPFLFSLFFFCVVCAGFKRLKTESVIYDAFGCRVSRQDIRCTDVTGFATSNAQKGAQKSMQSIQQNKQMAFEQVEWVSGDARGEMVVVVFALS